MPLVTRNIGQAQKRVELQNFQARKRLLEYDDVMNQQREVIYSLRMFALDKGEELKAEGLRMVEGALERAVIGHLAHGPGAGGVRPAGPPHPAAAAVPGAGGRRARPPRRRRTWTRSWPPSALAGREALQTGRRSTCTDFARTIGVPDVDEQVLSQVMLAVLDEKWKDHLYDLDQLRNAIQYRAYGQKRSAGGVQARGLRDVRGPDAGHPGHLHRAVPQDPGQRRSAAPGSSATPAPADSGAEGGRRCLRPDAGGGTDPIGARTGSRAKPGGGTRRQGRWAAQATGAAVQRGSRAQRSLSLRLGQEVQEVPRGGAVARPSMPYQQQATPRAGRFGGSFASLLSTLTPLPAPSIAHWPDPR